jgi:FAD/FMN-containing dehydrogenase
MTAATLPADPHPILELLGDVPVVLDPALVRQKSRDFFWYSPILKEELKRVSAEVVVEARDEADVVRTAAACAKLRLPLTVRGAGTGNYGQCMPLAGGVVLDTTRMAGIEWHRGSVVRAQAGIRLIDLDTALRPSGWECRLHPSTKRTATLGGFVAGGSGGVGSVAWGGLREPGNILAARVVTVEETPRVIELRGDAAQKVNRAYGTTGIVTALEMPLSPAWPWIDCVVAFDAFEACMAAGQAVAMADGIVKKLLTPIAWPIPQWFKGIRDACPEGRHLLLCMVDEASMEPFRDVVAAHGGTVTHEAPTREGPGHTPLYEYAWNHTTLQALKVDKGVTYLQSLFPADRLAESVAEMRALFGDEVLMHLEFIRFGGRMTCSALQVVRYTTPERLREIMDLHEAHGVMIANPHVVTLEDGSRHKRVDADQLGFKREVDPFGLLNPGKMRSYSPAVSG